MNDHSELHKLVTFTNMYMFIGINVSHESVALIMNDCLST